MWIFLSSNNGQHMDGISIQNAKHQIPNTFKTSYCLIRIYTAVSPASESSWWRSIVLFWCVNMFPYCTFFLRNHANFRDIVSHGHCTSLDRFVLCVRHLRLIEWWRAERVRCRCCICHLFYSWVRLQTWILPLVFWKGSTCTSCMDMRNAERVLQNSGCVYIVCRPTNARQRQPISAMQAGLSSPKSRKMSSLQLGIKASDLLCTMDLWFWQPPSLYVCVDSRVLIGRHTC